LLQRTGAISPPLFAEKAIAYLCRQTASNFGDVRRMLQLAAAAVHSVLCNLEDDPSSVKNIANGIVEFRDVHAIMSKVYQDRFRDFLNSVQSPVVLIIICALAREVNGSTTKDVALQRMYQICCGHIENYGPLVGIPRTLKLSIAQFVEVLDVLRQVALIEMRLSDEAAPLRSANMLELTDSTSITLTQPYELVMTTCEIHERFGEKLRPIFL
jgi:hypothetical protein